MSAVGAVVLVGGIGTGLRPLTPSVPKPMLPTPGLPLLTQALSRIAEAGIEHVIPLGAGGALADLTPECGVR